MWLRMALIIINEVQVPFSELKIAIRKYPSHDMEKLALKSNHSSVISEQIARNCPVDIVHTKFCDKVEDFASQPGSCESWMVFFSHIFTKCSRAHKSNVNISCLNDAIPLACYPNHGRLRHSHVCEGALDLGIQQSRGDDFLPNCTPIIRKSARNPGPFSSFCDC